MRSCVPTVRSQQPLRAGLVYLNLNPGYRGSNQLDIVRRIAGGHGAFCGGKYCCGSVPLYLGFRLRYTSPTCSGCSDLNVSTQLRTLLYIFHSYCSIGQTWWWPLLAETCSFLLDLYIAPSSILLCYWLYYPTHLIDGACYAVRSMFHISIFNTDKTICVPYFHSTMQY